MARHYKTDGSAYEVHPREKTFTLDEIQGYVGGYFTPVRLDGDTILLCCEDAVLWELKPNKAATRIINEHNLQRFFTNNTVYGDILIVNNEEWDS